MKTTTARVTAADSDGYEDMRQRWGETRLLGLCLDAVQSLDLPPAELKAAEVGGFRPQMLLTLVTYCYTSGIYGSEDVAQTARCDKMGRYISLRSFPDAGAIRRFRRRNRAAIQRCLAYVLEYAWASSFLPFRLDDVFNSWLQPAGRRQVEALVREKLELAIITDMAEGD